MNDLPLSWYVSKLEKGEPFSSLVYGDGEFRVMSGKLTGHLYTAYRERVTAQLVSELNASLDDPDPTIIRGSDPCVLDWRTYQGRDVDVVREASECAQAALGGRQLEWVDGCVWDVAVREGQLGPLIRALRGRKLAQVSNYKLFVEWKGLQPHFTVATAGHDAASGLDWLERALVEHAGDCDCFVVCMGLGAIPLIMRLRKQMPQATFLDLGSTFDVFAGLGAERGWRRELYADPAKLKACIDANLAGL